MGEPVVSAELHLGNLVDKTARDIMRRACHEADHGPVWIVNRAGKRIGAIVTVDEAEAIPLLNEPLGTDYGPVPHPGAVNATIREGLKTAERDAPDSGIK
jgi:hypothetical protein